MYLYIYIYTYIYIYIYVYIYTYIYIYVYIYIYIYVYIDIDIYDIHTWGYIYIYIGSEFGLVYSSLRRCLNVSYCRQTWRGDMFEVGFCLSYGSRFRLGLTPRG